MPHIDLPRALEDYFAFAESTPTRHGRRFSITLPYQCGEKLDRLQWWYHVSPSEELMYEGEGAAVLRAQATARFRRHIERWLANTKQRLHGDDAIPRISAMPKVEAVTPIVEIVTPQPLPAKVVNG